ncbi:hypothetical protein FQA39_LY03743 [Lamprigera yunnana]|nr:hypothetical protein FQA39_LY03743 [Lamprigera yunnana]
MEDLRGKVAVVTGASAGIGAGIAKEFLKRGMTVVGMARRKNKVEDLSNQISNSDGVLYALEVDVTVEDQILKAFQWIQDNVGAIHVLVNSAGVYRDILLIHSEGKVWKEILNTNVMGLCIATREAVKNMQLNQVSGHIVHINSLAGHEVTSLLNMGMYAATKHAVTALTETLRQELLLVGSKIKVTSVSPALVKSDMLRSTIEAGGLNPTDEQIEIYYSENAHLEVDDVIDSVVFAIATPPHVHVQEVIMSATDAL